MSAHTEDKFNLEVMAEAVNYNDFIFSLILARMAPGCTVLDFGAGSGTFADQVARQGHTVSCVETEPHFQALLRDKGHQVQNKIENFSQAFEHIYSINVLEHIPDDQATLKGLSEKLKPGGRLVLYVPACQILFSQWDTNVGHIRRYGKRELIEKTEAAGLTVEDCRYCDSLGFFATLALKLANRAGGAVTPRMVGFYDRFLFPLSRVLDHALFPLLGKNLVLQAVKSS